MPLDQAQAALRQGNAYISGILVSNVGDPYNGAKHSGAVTTLLKSLLTDKRFEVQKAKQLSLFGVEMIGSIFTTTDRAFPRIPDQWSVHPDSHQKRHPARVENSR